MEAVAILYYLIAFVVVTSQGVHGQDRPKQKCTITRTFKMLTADCHGLNLETIPHDLHTDVEIMVVSFNRLRKLTVDSFSSYRNLKMLYLEDNLIVDIEEGTFSTLTELEVINLSLNGLNTIPLDLLYLPKLRKIYIENNKLDESSFEKKDDNVFSVSYLSMSHCGLAKLPSLEIFPDLYFLNVSGNHLTGIEPMLLSHACNLQEIDLNGNRKIFSNNFCECQDLDYYLIDKNIKLSPPFALNCSQIKFPHESECGNLTLSPETQDVYNRCVTHKQMMIKAAEMQKIWLAVGITLGIVIVVVIILIVCLYRRKRNKRQEQENTLNKSANGEDPDSTLLNRQVKPN